MTLRNAAGDVLNKAELTALTTQVAQPQPDRKFTADVFESYALSGEGEGNHESGKRRKFKAGTVISQRDFDALYSAATVTSISPATGPAAGGTKITLKGTRLSGVEGVLIGGTPCTEVKVVDDKTVTAKTPVGTAGAKSVVTKDDFADVTSANGFTYTA